MCQICNQTNGSFQKSFSNSSKINFSCMWTVQFINVCRLSSRLFVYICLHQQLPHYLNADTFSVPSLLIGFCLAINKRAFQSHFRIKVLSSWQFCSLLLSEQPAAIAGKNVPPTKTREHFALPYVRTEQFSVFLWTSLSLSVSASTRIATFPLPSPSKIHTHIHTVIYN